MIRPVSKIAPVSKPINLVAAKTYAHVDHDDQDSVIEGLIDTAIARVDAYAGILGRCMITQTWTQPYVYWDTGLRLPFPDVQSVVIRYRDIDDVEQTLHSDLYEIIEDERSAVVVFRDAFSTPSLNSDRFAPISVDITAGYGDSDTSVPMTIRHALYMMVLHWYDNRAPLGAIPSQAHELLQPYRRGVIL